MAESDYQRGLRGGDFGGSYNDQQAWKDWQDGQYQCRANMRAKEREEEANDEVFFQQQYAGPFTYNDFLQAIKAAGHQINETFPDWLSYYVQIGSVRRLITCYILGEFFYFGSWTRFLYNSETDIPREVLYKSLRINCGWDETFFAVSNSPKGNPLNKWGIIACNDKWNGIMNSGWIPTIHSNLFNLCKALEDN